MKDPIKTPPASVDAEQSVIGGLLLDNGAFDKVADILQEADFYQHNHRLLWTAIGGLISRREPCDVITLAEHLDSQYKLEEAGGLAYIGTLAKNTPSAANIKAYARIVRDKAQQRGLLRVASDIQARIYSEDGLDTGAQIAEAEKQIYGLANGHNQARFNDITQVLANVLDKVDDLYSKGDGLLGLSCGHHDLDRQLSGLEPGALIIVAGRPAMGKTAFAMGIAEHVAVNEEKPVAVFSLEMPDEQLAMRLMSSIGRINLQALRTGNLQDHDWPRLTTATEKLGGKPLFIDDSGGITPTELRARCRRLDKEHGGLGLVVIDYLQLMRSPNAENRTNEIGEITRALKELAKELKVPVVALSQLNRSLEQRTNKRPVMADLRESGNIEQDADTILFVYRDEVYEPDSADAGTAEIIIGKQRNGPIGTVRLAFLANYARFEGLMRED